MDRAEAYQVLIAEMKSVSLKSLASLAKLVGETVEKEHFTEAGKRYSLTVKILRKEAQTFQLDGNIHDNNSFRHELLEESLIIEK